MVAVWKFIALAAAIVSAVPVAQEPGIKVRDTADVVKVSVLESSGLEPRQQPKARARLMWSPQGRMLFTLALVRRSQYRSILWILDGAEMANTLSIEPTYSSPTSFLRDGRGRSRCAAC